jgi:hypothetical protein
MASIQSTIFVIVTLGIICSIFLLSSCTQIKNMDKNITDNYCKNHGYIQTSEVNYLINATNRLIDITNICMKEQNVTPLNHIIYYKEE